MSGNNGHSSFDSSSKLDVILERMDFQDKEISDIKKSVEKVTELVANPETGIYGRVKLLETSKRNNSKAFWIIASAVLSLVFSSALWMKFFTN